MSEKLKHIEANFGENWFTSPSVYRLMVSNCSAVGHIVEVGAWKGRSSAFLVVEAYNHSPFIDVDIVDTWEGSEEHTDAEKNNLFNIFTSNMYPLSGLFTPRRMTSLEAAATYEDESLDAVYIDAAHDYESVKADIAAWGPKIKPNGILAGHDYRNGFPGVDRAVDEVFPAGTVAFCEYSWVVKKAV